MMHLYAFGSICRGDIDPYSDVDILALTKDLKEIACPVAFSTYRYERIREIWRAGNAFAWHLNKEAKLVYSEDGSDFLTDLNAPAPYQSGQVDCERFYTQCRRAIECLDAGTSSAVFELSAVFLSIRNFAICYGLGVLGLYEFSRDAALRLGEKSIDIDPVSYATMQRARLLSVRGIGDMLSAEEIGFAKAELPKVAMWMDKLMKEIE